MTDSKQMKKGRNYSYKNLRNSYVIFICREDIFKDGQYKYSFENTCTEVPGLKLNDGAYKIFFNTKGIKGNVSDDVKGFLQAVEGIETNNAFANELKAQADEIKADETWRESYMQSLLRDQDKFDSGFEQGKLETAKSLLKMGLTVQQVMEGTRLDLDAVEELERELSTQKN